MDYQVTSVRFTFRSVSQKQFIVEGGISNIISGRHAESYEDIDRNTVPQSQPVQSGGYNPASAQRI